MRFAQEQGPIYELQFPGRKVIIVSGFELAQRVAQRFGFDQSTDVQVRKSGSGTLLEQGAIVYVCGDASRMEPDVRQALLVIYRAKTGQDEVAAQQWLDALASDKRYRVDVWAAG